MESRGCSLSVVSLAPASSNPQWTLSSALAELEQTLAVAPPGMPLRLVGTSVGGLLASQYAERHPEVVDSLFLLAPAFDLAACLQRGCGGEASLAGWQASGSAEVRGIRLGWAAFEDARSLHRGLPFVRCRAYVVAGLRDSFADLAETLAWVYAASSLMRREGEGGDGQEACRPRLAV